MKKIYISVPMNGRSDDDIRASIDKMVKCTRILLDDEITVVNEFKPHHAVSDNIPMHHDVQALGESIALMSLADVFVTVDWGYESRGCDVERHVAGAYGFPIIGLPPYLICPDLKPKEEACACLGSVPV